MSKLKLPPDFYLNFTAKKPSHLEKTDLLSDGIRANQQAPTLLKANIEFKTKMTPWNKSSTNHSFLGVPWFFETRAAVVLCMPLLEGGWKWNGPTSTNTVYIVQHI